MRAPRLGPSAFSGRQLNRVYLLFFVPLLTVTQGCIATVAGGKASGPPFTEVSPIPQNHCVVYIYRLPGRYMSGTVFPVMANEQLIVKLHSEGYHPYVCKPGKLSLSSNPGIPVLMPMFVRGLAMDVEAGKVYYVELKPFISALVGTRMMFAHTETSPDAEFLLTPAEKGRGDIAFCRLDGSGDQAPLEKPPAP